MDLPAGRRRFPPPWPSVIASFGSPGASQSGLYCGPILFRSEHPIEYHVYTFGVIAVVEAGFQFAVFHLARHIGIGAQQAKEIG